MTSAMRFSTALRQNVRNKIEQMGHADIVDWRAILFQRPVN
jgi:hypothetical protein